jgi:hypothetical protein
MLLIRRICARLGSAPSTGRSGATIVVMATGFAGSPTHSSTVVDSSGAGRALGLGERDEIEMDVEHGGRP